MQQQQEQQQGDGHDMQPSADDSQTVEQGMPSGITRPASAAHDDTEAVSISKAPSAQLGPVSKLLSATAGAASQPPPVQPGAISRLHTTHSGSISRLRSAQSGLASMSSSAKAKAVLQPPPAEHGPISKPGTTQSGSDSKPSSVQHRSEACMSTPLQPLQPFVEETAPAAGASAAVTDLADPIPLEAAAAELPIRASQTDGGAPIVYSSPLAASEALKMGKTEGGALTVSSQAQAAEDNSHTSPRSPHSYSHSAPPAQYRYGKQEDELAQASAFEAGGEDGEEESEEDGSSLADDDPYPKADDEDGSDFEDLEGGGLREGEAELLSVSFKGYSKVQRIPSSVREASLGGTSDNDVTIDGVRILGRKYEVQHVVGEGAYGLVMKCRVTDGSGRHVAVKSFKIEDDDPDAEDVKRTSRREVALLRALQHAHVVGLVDEFYVRDRLFIVMEFVPCNLLELLEAQPGGMERNAVRHIMLQLCTVMAFIHSKNVVYRDIKPENLLVDEQGCLKLCDFGFARYLNGPGEPLTDYVATRWYRAPELLLGSPYPDGDRMVQNMYGAPIDMWAIGCLMGELMDGEPLFPGDSDLDQLYKVQQVLGPLVPEHQAAFDQNPQNIGIYFNFKDRISLAKRYEGKMDGLELEFLSGLLCMDPQRRLTGEQCLQHPYLADLVEADLAATGVSRPLSGASFEASSLSLPSALGYAARLLSGADAKPSETDGALLGRNARQSSGVNSMGASEAEAGSAAAAAVGDASGAPGGSGQPSENSLSIAGLGIGGVSLSFKHVIEPTDLENEVAGGISAQEPWLTGSCLEGGTTHVTAGAGGARLSLEEEPASLHDGVELPSRPTPDEDVTEAASESAAKHGPRPRPESQHTSTQSYTPDVAVNSLQTAAGTQEQAEQQDEQEGLKVGEEDVSLVKEG